MNEEVETLKERIYTFLESKEIEPESQYFLLLSMVEELKEDIISEDDEEDESVDDEEPEEAEDTFKDFEPEEIGTPEEQVKQDYEKADELMNPTSKPSKSGHALKMKELLKKKNDKSD